MKYLKYLNLLWQNMKWQKISICKGVFLPFDMDVLLLGWQCEWQGTSRFFHLLNNHRTVLNQTKSRLFCDWLKDDKILKILRLVEGLGYLYFMNLVNWLSRKTERLNYVFLVFHDPIYLLLLFTVTSLPLRVEWAKSLYISPAVSDLYYCNAKHTH